MHLRHASLKPPTIDICWAPSMSRSLRCPLSVIITGRAVNANANAIRGTAFKSLLHLNKNIKRPVLQFSNSSLALCPSDQTVCILTQQRSAHFESSADNSWLPVMKRSTGFLYLVLVLIVCWGFTLGLTWAPCYASLCSEEFYAYDTRIHIIVYYALLASTGGALLLRAYSPLCRSISNRYLTKREVPVLGKRISVGGLFLAFWILTLTLVTTAFWVTTLENFWVERTGPLQWANAQVSLVVTGVIGHHADTLLGLVLIPVSRNSVLGRVFTLHQSTLLYAHKLIAYLLVVAVTAHGLAYFVSTSFHHGSVGSSVYAMNCRPLSGVISHRGMTS